MAFTRHKRSGYARLGKIDSAPSLYCDEMFSVRIQSLEVVIVHGEVTFDATCLRILPVLLKEKNMCLYL